MSSQILCHITHGKFCCVVPWCNTDILYQIRGKCHLIISIVSGKPLASLKVILLIRDYLVWYWEVWKDHNITTKTWLIATRLIFLLEMFQHGKQKYKPFLSFLQFLWLILLVQEEFKVSERYITMSDLTAALEENRVKEMFGAGTACVVCPISKILYKGKVRKSVSFFSSFFLQNFIIN